MLFPNTLQLSLNKECSLIDQVVNDSQQAESFAQSFFVQQSPFKPSFNHDAN